MQPTDLELPYTVLVEIVRSFEQRGRPCYGAQLKPEFLKTLGDGINERTLGFRRFGDFLRAAQFAGRITVVQHLGGDLEVKLPRAIPLLKQLDFPLISASELTSRPTVPTRPRTPAMRIRPDLWKAFNAVSSGWSYDRTRDLATRPSEAEIQEHKEQWVAIPSARPRTLAWMRSFAEIQEAAIRGNLLAKLDADSNQFAFEQLLKEDPGLLRAWRRYHVHQVISEIQLWAETNGLSPMNVAEPFRQTPKPEASLPSVAASASLPLVGATTSELEEPRDTTYLETRVDSALEQLIDQLIMFRGLLALSRAKTKQN